MEKSKLKKLIEIATGRQKADLVIKNSKIVDVYNFRIIEGDIAISDDLIAGVGEYSGEVEIDANGKFASPGLIDGHIHVESSYVSPEELGRMVVPHGTTTIVADPHEIVNVFSIKGLDYMIEASKGTALDIKWMLPTCVPATPFEHSGAVIDSNVMREPIKRDDVFGVGEFMNFPGLINTDDDVLEKISIAQKEGKVIDGHCPGIKGNSLNAYASAGIRADHECETVDDMLDRISRGMYVMLRQGSACHDLTTMLKGLTERNSRRCVFCADDLQPKTILSKGHIDNNLRMCVEAGVDPIVAISIGTINTAECFKMDDRGAIAPGKKANIVLFDNLKDFNAKEVFIDGKSVAKDGAYLPEIKYYSPKEMTKGFNVKDFSVEKLKLQIKSNKANVIKILPGGVVTAKEVIEINRDENEEFVFSKDTDIVKVAVVERHQNTGNVAKALLKGYGIKEGAIALSIAHDSHNIIVVGVNDQDMSFAVEELIKQGGGIILVKDNKVIESMPMIIGGIMSDKSGEWVRDKLTTIHQVAHKELKVSEDVEPVMTLCFMSLAVIPEVKLTDMGLFDVTKFDFIDIEA
ncbi:MAG: adenine deaminase [Clostridioides sp.]|jgi:adenine deaminase|nr:adenine deaminase [Clostridioides sp.]